MSTEVTFMHYVMQVVTVTYTNFHNIYNCISDRETKEKVTLACHIYKHWFHTCAVLVWYTTIGFSMESLSTSHIVLLLFNGN